MSNLVILLCIFCCCILHSITAVSVLETPDNITVLIGDDVTFRCRFVELINEQIIWFHIDSNEVLTKNAILETVDPDKQSRYTIVTDNNEWFNLTIRNVSYVDEGEYKCGYSRNRGDGGANVFLASAFLDVVTMPSSPACNIAYPGGIKFPVIGDSVSIECSAPGGDPNPEITWFRDDVIESMASEVERLSVELTLRQERDRGVTFRCGISSIALESVESCQLVPFPRIPMIDISPVNGLIDFGSNIPFQCDVDGDLPLTILSFVTSLAIERFTLAGNILTILDFQEDDLTATVTCEVTYDDFDEPFTSTVMFEALLPELNDKGGNEVSPNTEDDTSTLTIVLVVLGVIVVILVITALLWYHRKKIMPKNTSPADP